MAFCSSSSFSRFCQTKNTIPYKSPPSSITAAAFGSLTALGQVPLTGISGNFATYSVLNNGATVATDQTASTYTITGLGNNVQIGPVTLVPYDSQGVAGTAFTVTGGNGAGMIYTWAQANAPTFSAITTSGTTLACTGTFSKIYVSYSGGAAGTPASDVLINTANSISQAYTGLAGNTTYTFVVYPVNGDGIPGSATGTNMATAPVTTLTPPSTLWVAAGQGTGNTLAYSSDGITWSGLGTNVINSQGFGVAYSAFQNLWVAAGSGTGNTLAYSSDGITWTGLAKSIFSSYGYYATYSAKQNRWTATGNGTGVNANSLAYSTDGINWIGRGISIFSTTGYNVAYSAFQDRWVAAGTGTGNSLAYSMDGINWSGRGLSIFSAYGRGVAYSEKQDRWVAAGQGGNSLAYSSDGINWIGRGISIFSTTGYSVAYSEKQACWVAAGTGGNTLAYSSDGINWTGQGKSIFSGNGRGVAYSAFQDRWTAVGQGGNSLAYSTDGITWTGRGNIALMLNVYCVACDN